MVCKDALIDSVEIIVLPAWWRQQVCSLPRTVASKGLSDYFLKVLLLLGKRFSQKFSGIVFFFF